MKKYLVLVLTLLSICFLTVGVEKLVIAKADQKVSTNILLPKTYLEYYQLYSPIDVWTNEKEFVISQPNKIIYFDGELYHSYELTQNVSRVYKLNNNIIFLAGSKIYTINVQTNLITEQTSINSAGTSFDIYNGILVTNPSNEIRYYLITDSENFVCEELTTKLISLSYTPNTLSLNGANQTETLFYSFESNVHKLTPTENTVIATNLSNIRSISSSDNAIFVCYKDGIKKFDYSGNELAFLPISGNNSLDNITEPNCGFYVNNSLFVADKSLNAILGVNATDLKINGFSITANHNSISRISQDVKEIQVVDNELFILDKNLKKLNLENNEITEYSLSSYSGLKFFATTNNTVLLSSGTNLIFAKFEKGELETISINSPLSRFENVTAITTFENDYYVLNNETINNQQRAVIYKLSTQTAEIETHSSFLGRGDDLTSDVFGDIYVALYNYNTASYSVNATDISASKNKVVSSSANQILSIFADYEGNVFALYENNIITKTSPTKTETFEIEKSKNLPELSQAIDFSLSLNNETVYLLYKGYVLTMPSVEIGVATPNKIAVPENFGYVLSDNLTFVTVKNGAKLFEINLEKTPVFGEYFNYEKMKANQNVTKQFVLITSTERYSLIASKDMSAIVRTEDMVSFTPEIIESSQKGYFVNDCSTYVYPIIANQFSLDGFTKNQKVEIKKQLTFNGESYSFISCNDKQGYVATSMLKSGIAFEKDPNLLTTKILTKNAVAYYDVELTNKCAELNSGDQIMVISQVNDQITKVLVNGTECYVLSDCLKSKSPQIIKNVIVISILFLSLFITAIYFSYRVFSSKRTR